MDYAVYHIGGGENFKVPTVEHCRAQCIADPKCSHFSWASEYIQNDYRIYRSCWFKDKGKSIQDAPGMYSGPADCKNLPLFPTAATNTSTTTVTTATIATTTTTVSTMATTTTTTTLSAMATTTTTTTLSAMATTTTSSSSSSTTTTTTTTIEGGR